MQHCLHCLSTAQQSEWALKCAALDNNKPVVSEESLLRRDEALYGEEAPHLRERAANGDAVLELPGYGNSSGRGGGVGSQKRLASGNLPPVVRGSRVAPDSGGSGGSGTEETVATLKSGQQNGGGAVEMSGAAANGATNGDAHPMQNGVKPDIWPVSPEEIPGGAPAAAELDRRGSTGRSMHSLQSLPWPFVKAFLCHTHESSAGSVFSRR